VNSTRYRYLCGRHGLLIFPSYSNASQRTRIRAFDTFPFRL
jgi:hypothetical protein